MGSGSGVTSLRGQDPLSTMSTVPPARPDDDAVRPAADLVHQPVRPLERENARRSCSRGLEARRSMYSTLRSLRKAAVARATSASADCGFAGTERGHASVYGDPDPASRRQKRPVALRCRTTGASTPPRTTRRPLTALPSWSRATSSAPGQATASARWRGRRSRGPARSCDAPEAAVAPSPPSRLRQRPGLAPAVDR